MSSQRQRYISYLLRLWQIQDDDGQIWRFSLESPGTGERRGFATLWDLVDFLQAQIKAPPRCPTTSDSEEHCKTM